MDEELQDAPEVLETPEEEVTEEEEAPLDDEKEQLKAKVADLESKNKQLFERAKKKDPEPLQEPALSPKDYLALTEAKVSSDDFDEIMEYAAFKKISVAEALKTSTLHTILGEKAEQRKTAEATNTRSSRGTSKTSGDELLLKARRTGEVPDSEEGMQNLFKARQAERFKTRK